MGWVKFAPQSLGEHRGEKIFAIARQLTDKPPTLSGNSTRFNPQTGTVPIAKLTHDEFPPPPCNFLAIRPASPTRFVGFHGTIAGAKSRKYFSRSD